jgi:hypothetical protein
MSVQLYSEFKFEPHINEISEKIVVEKKQFQGKNKDFLERQRVFQDMKEAKVEMLHSAVEGKQSTIATFTPSIGNAEAVLVSGRPELLAETVEERVLRLSKLDKKRRDALMYVVVWTLSYRHALDQ